MEPKSVRKGLRSAKSFKEILFFDKIVALDHFVHVLGYYIIYLYLRSLIHLSNEDLLLN